MATATLCPSRPPLQLPRSLDPTKSPQSRPRSLQTATLHLLVPTLHPLVPCFTSTGRPQEQGRYVVVRADADGRPTDITPPPYNARTRVHEYGGGSWTVRDGTVYFSNFADGRLYRQGPGTSEPQALTPEPPARGRQW